MKDLLIFLFFLFITQLLQAQEEVVSYRNTVSLEFGGAGGYYSFNYEHSILEKEKMNLGLRGGLTVYHFLDFDRKFNPDLLVPLALTGRYGRVHHVEMTLGQGIGSFVVLNEIHQKGRDASFSFFAEAGYRYQKGRFMARVYYSPLFLRYSEWRNWYGVGFGYAFNKK